MQQLTTDFLFCYRFTLSELLQFLKVLLRKECDTFAFAAISSRTSRFLIITFQTLRYIIMNHKPHIGFVNSHTKSNGCHYHVDFLHHELVLSFRAHLLLQSSMIGSRTNLVRLKNFSQFFHLLARETIDNTTLAFVLTDELDDFLIYILGFRTYFVIQVRTIERRLKVLGILNAQTLLNICTHLIGSCSGQSNDWRLANLLNNRTNLSVFWTEIMSPLRNTMRLIHSIKRNLHRLQKLHIVLLGQRFRSHI